MDQSKQRSAGASSSKREKAVLVAEVQRPEGAGLDGGGRVVLRAEAGSGEAGGPQPGQAQRGRRCRRSLSLPRATSRQNPADDR